MDSQKYSGSISGIKPHSLLIALVFFVMTSCSQISFLYDYADWYIMYKIDDYFDLNDIQEDQLEEKVELLHTWHRDEEIPKVVAFLKQAKSALGNGFTEQNMPWIESEYQKLRHRIDDKITTDVATFLTSLSKDQIKYFERRLNESNQGYEKLLRQNEDEWQKAELEKAIDRIEDWFGSLSDEQEKEIVASFHANVHFDKNDLVISYSRRKEMQKRIVDLLYQKKSTQEIRLYISAWFMDTSIFNTNQYNQVIKKRRQSWMKFWLDLNRQLTIKQKRYVLDKLQGHIEDLESIHQSS
jgi:hypothetical protein